MIDLYNDSWRDDEEPLLLEKDFISKLQIHHISIHRPEEDEDPIDVYFSIEEELFGEHNVVVNLLACSTFLIYP
mgnify:CR=1 FL=1